MAYVIHVCRNSKQPKDSPDYCENVWVDVDKTNVTLVPPSWKYCSECVKKGFKNPRTRKCTMTPEQIEAFKIRMKEYRKNKQKGNKENEN